MKNQIEYPFPCDEQLASLEEIQGTHVSGAQTSCETFSPPPPPKPPQTAKTHFIFFSQLALKIVLCYVIYQLKSNIIISYKLKHYNIYVVTFGCLGNGKEREKERERLPELPACGDCTRLQTLDLNPTSRLYSTIICLFSNYAKSLCFLSYSIQLPTNYLLFLFLFLFFFFFF